MARKACPLEAPLLAVYTEPKSVSSDFARYNAQSLGALASRGFITTQVPGHPGTYSKLWRVTPAGLNYLNERGQL